MSFRCKEPTRLSWCKYSPVEYHISVNCHNFLTWDLLSLAFSICEFQVGLLYDEDSLQAVVDMTYDWTKEEREMLRNKVCHCTVIS